MNQNKSNPAVLMLLFIFHITTAKSVLAAEEKRDLTFGFSPNPFVIQTSFGGKGMAALRELFERGADEFNKYYGYGFTLKIYPAPKFLFKGFHEKTTDFAPTYVSLFLAAKSQNVPLKPVLTYSVTGKKGGKYCIYVHKDSGIKNVKQLEGKTFVSEFPWFNSRKDPLPPPESYIYWTMIKKLMQKNKINKTFHAFFKEFKIVPVPYESVAYSVLIREFDAFFNDEGELQALLNYDKGFAELKAIECMEVPVWAPVVYRTTLEPDVVEKFKRFLTAPPKGSAMEKMLKKEFKGIKFVPVKEKDYEPYFQWLKEAGQKGWIKEFNEIMKTAPRPKQKKEQGKDASSQ